MVNRVEVVVVGRQRGHMHQALDVDVAQFDENAETGHRGDHTGEGLTNTILHELALEPVDHVAGRLVGATLGHRALLAEFFQGRLVIRIDACLGHDRRPRTLNVLGVALGTDHAANGSMHQQVRVATDRRGEVGISLVIETEVPFVLRAIYRLAQRTQHHGLDQVIVRALADAFQ